MCNCNIGYGAYCAVGRSQRSRIDTSMQSMRLTRWNYITDRASTVAVQVIHISCACIRTVQLDWLAVIIAPRSRSMQLIMHGRLRALYYAILYSWPTSHACRLIKVREHILYILLKAPDRPARFFYCMHAWLFRRYMIMTLYYHIYIFFLNCNIVCNIVYSNMPPNCISQWDDN
jgi:hypothetical protein